MTAPLSTPTRVLRRLLAIPALALLAGLLVLAGCGGGASANNSTSPTATTAPAATATTAPTAAPSPTSSTGGGGQAAVTVGGVSTYKFSPGTMTVKVGTTVTWTNGTQAPHTVTSDSGDPASFNGSLDSNGSTFSFTFTQPGTYNYHCSVHPYMTATITVTA